MVQAAGQGTPPRPSTPEIQSEQPVAASTETEGTDGGESGCVGGSPPAPAGYKTFLVDGGGNIAKTGLPLPDDATILTALTALCQGHGVSLPDLSPPADDNDGSGRPDPESVAAEAIADAVDAAAADKEEDSDDDWETSPDEPEDPAAREMAE
eukprot:COSAG01_NODE_36014_length_523_cov_3.311321_1_plen_152_part_10